MRKTIVDIANLTAAVMVGAYLFLLTVFRTEGLRNVPGGIVDSWVWWTIFLLVGGGLVAANIMILVQEWKAGILRENLVMSTEQGVTEFSVSSLEMLILRDLRAEPDVVDPVVFLQPKGEGKPMLCNIEFKLRRQKDVLKRADAIKRKVRDVIDNLIPGGLTVEVFVKVRDVVSEAAGRNSRSGREILPEPGEFNGPVYTDGGGSEGV